MTAERLTEYLTTQSNVIAAVEGGEMALEQAAAWIVEGVRPFFEGKARTMKFSGNIWFCCKRG